MKSECRPANILDKLNTLERWDDKKSYIGDILEECGICTPQEPTVRTLKKRQMNSWNCYLKKCTQTGMPFKECLTDKKRKQKEYTPKVEYWKDLAKKNC